MPFTVVQNKINGKEDRDVEKQWQLQKKVFDLTAQMSQLDKRLAAVKEENELLVSRYFSSFV
jgi:phage shock protein A